MFDNIAAVKKSFWEQKAVQRKALTPPEPLENATDSCGKNIYLSFFITLFHYLAHALSLSLSLFLSFFSALSITFFYVFFATKITKVPAKIQTQSCSKKIVLYTA